MYGILQSSRHSLRSGGGQGAEYSVKRDGELHLYCVVQSRLS